MIISVNWLKKFTDIDMPIDQLATLIGERLVEIEEVIDLGEKYKDVIIARVVSCVDMPDSNHLHICTIDDGGVRQGVERDDNGYVQVVCGAPNVREGLMVAWLPPEAVVPETFGADPFVLGARKLRGHTSNGMLASAKELDLFDDHEGILEVDGDVAPGTKFAEAYELNDHLLDIENKSLTHRPDTFGIIGFAREVAAIQGKAFSTPDWLQQLTPHYDDVNSDVVTPSVTIDDPNLSARFQAVVLNGVNGAAKSPLAVQTYLARIGMRPINAVVDATNYLMMLTGQPMGIYDYDKILALDPNAHLHVRSGRDGEPLELLDGRTIELSKEDIVVTAGDTPIGLAGAMGGANTVVDDQTKTILIEAATFNLYSLRATQMRHGVFSEAITRFTKGQPAELAAPVLASVVHLVSEWTGATRASQVVEDYPIQTEKVTIDVAASRVNATLGTNDPIEHMLETLKHVEFDASMTCDDENTSDGTLHVTAPYWRADIHIPEDVIEEIGRINSYDSITPTLAKRDFTAVRPSDFDELRARIRESLVRAGANEVLTYSFVHGNILEKAGLDQSNSYRITNSISPDLQYYRQSLTPSLLGLIHPNIKQGYEHFAVFELNKTHPKHLGLTDEQVPVEADSLALTTAGKKSAGGSAYYQAKRMLDYLASNLNLELEYRKVESSDNVVAAPFESRRAAVVADKKSGVTLGVIGEYKKTVARGFKLPDYAAGFELDTRSLFAAASTATSDYTPLSRYPGSERDVCFQVANDVSYGQLVSCVQNVLDGVNLEVTVSPIDIYQAQGSETKNITLRIKLTAHDRTLSSDEIAEVISQVTSTAESQVAAKIV
jgi:phenylalanyl-tRNA synthetase beta chain